MMLLKKVSFALFFAFLLIAVTRTSHAQTTAEEINRSIRLTIAPRLTITIPPITISPFPTRNLTGFPIPSGSATGLVATIRASACSTIIASMKDRAKTLADSMERTVAKLTSLADAVNNYYTKTLVPAGKTVPDYDKMMSDMNAKKAALTALISDVKQNASGMSCGNGDLRSQMTAFSSRMQNLIDAVRLYTTSVRTFVAAVRSVSASAPTTAPTSVTSITPTITP